MEIKVSVSVMAADFSQQGADLVKSADMLHIDVMDGAFVPNKTVWTEVVAGLQTDLPKDVHLMIMNPEEYVEEFIEAGADRISFHIESTDCPEAVIGLIQAKGVKAGIALKPETHIDMIKPFLESVDFVLVMSVEPGRGGQNFMKESLDKIKLIREKFPSIGVSVDGGINSETAKEAVRAGANILISGTYIYSGDVEEKIRELRKPS